MFLQNYVHRYIAKIYTNTQAWWLHHHFWDKLFSLCTQVYTGLFEHTSGKNKGKLLDAHICILSRLNNIGEKKTKQKKSTKHTWKFKSRLSQSNTMWSQLRSTGGAGNRYWSNHAFGIVGHSTLYRKTSSLKSIKADETKRITVKERMTFKHDLCSLYGLCPSISEYLTTPEEKIKHTITTWLRCAGELERERKKKDHIPGFNWC